MKAEDVLVVVVLYDTKAEPCNSLKTLLAHPQAQKMAWVIWDNHPMQGMEVSLQNWLSNGVKGKPIRWRYEAHAENSGLSSAYLAASVQASEWGCTWMLLADQDTHFPADWWDGYSSSIQEGKYGLILPLLFSSGMCISPAVHRMGMSRPNPRPSTGELDLYRYMPVNSGMLIRLSDYNQCGGHIPEVCLDFSDTAWVYRLRSAGIKAAVAPIVCDHGLSGIEPGSYRVRLQRYRQFCRDARAWAKTEGPMLMITVLVVARALRLSTRYLRFGFMHVLLRHYFLGKPL